MIDKDYILSFQDCLQLLIDRLSEPAPGRIQLLVGPRQVGKTTLLLELEKRFKENTYYIALDSPEASLPGFWDRFWEKIEEAARTNKTVFVLIDEVHVFPNWSVLLKAQWDRLIREKLPVHIVATGSSALSLATASRESLAGRFEKLMFTHWMPSNFAKAFSLSFEEAVEMFVRMGAYPGAFKYVQDFPRWKAYVRDSIIEAIIGRDIVSLMPIRKPALLRQIFAICTSIPAQIISLQKLVGQLEDAGAIETVAHYLTLLEEAFLVASVPKYSSKEIRIKASPPKIVVLSNALIAATNEANLLDAQKESQRFGTWVENACLAIAWNSGQKVYYWREEPFEVDAVIEGSWGKWAIEVKTGRFSFSDLKGLHEFKERYPNFSSLVICDEEGVQHAERMQFQAISWKQFLLDPSLLKTLSNKNST